MEMDWSLESYFDEFGSADYSRFKRELASALSGLHARIDALDGIEPAEFAAWQAVVQSYEEIERRISHLTSYLDCLTAADAANETFHREQADLAVHQAELTKCEVAIIAQLGAARHEHLDAFLKRDALADANFALRRWREKARRTMPKDEEALAAELEVDGLKAWSRLYDSVSGTLQFTVTHPDGRVEAVPMSRRRSLLAHPDRRVRASAFTSGNAAWQSVESVCAAALNAIAGTRLTLNHHRNHGHFLEPAAFQHCLGIAALQALQEALLAQAGVSRGLLHTKAARIGVPAISWYDLEAPTPGIAGAEPAAALSWTDGAARVQTAFARAYPALGAFLGEMLENRWIDHTPRAGKRPGAFCTGSLLTGESRIFMSFDDGMNDVVTLAHEAGHAWHARVLRDQRPLARAYPMTLAESASTFAEMLLIDSLLDDDSVPVAMKRQVLDSQVRQATAFLLDVPMRFEFECRFHEERSEGEVPVSRLKALMVDAQRKLFGDALAAGGEDAMFWASKLHFYIADVSFYNFPYTVGFLLSRALFARFKQEGADFLPRYEAFLARTGSATCETLAKDVLGADLERPDFWSTTIDSLAEIGQRYAAV
jgi:oligoendopeptidase F